jgi:AmmeMemoRadiSam system protein A
MDTGITTTQTLTLDERRFLMKLARQAIEAAVIGKPMPPIPEADLTESLRRPADTFVTLNKFGELRGCIGSLGAGQPLYRSVIDSAQAAATRDPRFPPVTRAELPHIEVEISVLTPARPLTFSSLDELRKLLKPHVHGVIIQNGFRRALYLPQVWEHFEGRHDMVEAFLSSLSMKAGDWTGTLWRDPGTRYEVFEAECFTESDVEEEPPVAE